MTTLGLTVSTINVPRKIGADDWARCFERAMADGSTLLGAQEIFTSGQRQTLAQVCKAQGWDHAGRSGPNPVAWDAAAWTLVRSRVVRLHGPGEGLLARRWPGYNAERHVTVAVLQHRETGQRVTLLNAHLVAYGPRVPAAWRAAAFAASVTRLRRLVKRARRRGQHVVVTGDFNTRGRIPVGVKWTSRGIDRIGYKPAPGWRGDAFVKPFLAPTDHRYGQRARITLKERP